MIIRVAARTQCFAFILAITASVASHAQQSSDTRLFSDDSLSVDVSLNQQYESASCTVVYRVTDYVTDIVPDVASKFPFRPCYQRVSRYGLDLLVNAGISDGERVILVRNWIHPVDQKRTIVSMGSLSPNAAYNNAIIDQWLKDERALDVTLYKGMTPQLNKDITVIYHY